MPHQKSFWLLLLFLPHWVLSANVTNQIQANVPSMKPYLCVEDNLGNTKLELAPGQQGNINQASGNRCFAGAKIRLQGCEKNAPYLGYLAINTQNHRQYFSPPEGLHVCLNNLTIDHQGHLTGNLTFTPIDINPNLTKLLEIKRPWPMVGIHLSGLEQGTFINPALMPNLSVKDQNTPYSDLKKINVWIKKGINTIRVPLNWAYLQPDGPGIGTLNHDYYDNFVEPLLATLTQAKIHTILDLHAFMHYSPYDQTYSGCGDQCVEGKMTLDGHAYLSIWDQLLSALQQDKNIDLHYVIIDIMNEPVYIPDSKVFDIQAEVIRSLRAKHFDGLIMVEGNSWSNLHSWTHQTWTGDDGKTYSNVTLLTREAFAKKGITDLSNIAIAVHQYLDHDFSGTHNECQSNLNSQGPDGFNLDAFFNYLKQNRIKAVVTELGSGSNESSCMEPLHAFLDYMATHSAEGKDYGFLGLVLAPVHQGLKLNQPTSYQSKALIDYLKGD